jgi:2-haloacid dehalogenase
VTIRAVVFDAYGTLYDTQSVLAKAEEVCPGNGELITQIWRLKQLEYSWLRSLVREYQDFWEVTSTSLDFALRAAGIEPTRSVRDPLMEQYLYLEPYPEVPAALAALDGHRLAILSNGSPTMLEVLVRNSGLGRWIETVISVDRVRTYKPSPACYALVEEVLGIAKPEILFVSSNGFDVVGAKTFGFQVAWIHRAGGDAQAAPLGASAMFRMLRGRAEELGHAPDHTLSALTELPQLL